MDSETLSVQDFWLFGYGSLIWKPPPHYDQRLPGSIQGFVRRFWQVSLTARSILPELMAVSEDHRGTPDNPGRVVTLIERSFWETLEPEQAGTEPDRVWGAAYHIIPDRVDEVKAYLDIREINGYSVRYTRFQPADSALAAIRCLVYIGMPDNPQFTGPLQPQALAEHINQSVGPSGENRDYLLQLEDALNQLGKDSGDAHVSDLASRVKVMKAPERKLQDMTDAHDAKLGKVSSLQDAQEETESGK